MEGIRVVPVGWFLLTACFICLAVSVSAQTEAVDGRAEEVSALLGSLFGFRPCIDESCRNLESSESAQPELDKDYETQEYEPQDSDESNSNENPQVHCIILRPSAVKTFGEIERMHPGLSDIKYKVLEELIDHMYTFGLLKLENCDSPMKLVDLVILAANSLKTQYVLKGESNCSYRSSTSRKGLSTPMPEESSYPTQDHEEPQTPCPVEQITEQPHLQVTEEPCPESIPEHPQQVVETQDKPCTETMDFHPHEEILDVEIESVENIDEAHLSPPFVGSLRGIPGIHYPNYTEIPITSFTCADKKYIPGFYADLETGCQVFHVCYEHRRESFLCPLGTIFNQPILACDYWYSSNCSLATSYYKVNERTDLEGDIDDEVQELVSEEVTGDSEQTAPYEPDEKDLDTIAHFLPVKAKVVDLKPMKETVSIAEPVAADVDKIASDIFDNIMVTATKVTSKTRDIVRSIPEPSVEEHKVKVVRDYEPMKLEDVLAQSIIPVAKAKMFKATLPVVAKAKLAIPVIAAKAAVPVVAKAKLAATVPIAKAVAAKAKVAAAVPVAKVVAAKSAVPVLATKAKIAKAVAAKAKVAAAAVPVAKVVAAKSAVPVLATKAKIAKVAAVKAAVPVAKVAAVKAAVPVAKVAAVKAAVPVAKVAAVKAAVPVAKVAAVKAAVPVAKVAAVKAAVPVAKVAAVKAAVPVAKVAAVKASAPVVVKAKVAAAIPVVKTAAVKAAIPALKTKMLASAVPLAKAKVFSPVLKGKVIAGGKAPFLKAKMMALPLAKTKLAGSIPLAKVKLAKAAAISPLTKKALAVGYMKLLKAKKLAVMG